MKKKYIKKRKISKNHSELVDVNGTPSQDRYWVVAYTGRPYTTICTWIRDRIGEVPGFLTYKQINTLIRIHNFAITGHKKQPQVKLPAPKETEYIVFPHGDINDPKFLTSAELDSRQMTEGDIVVEVARARRVCKIETITETTRLSSLDTSC